MDKYLEGVDQEYLYKIRTSEEDLKHLEDMQMKLEEILTVNESIIRQKTNELEELRQEAWSALQDHKRWQKEHNEKDELKENQ